MESLPASTVKYRIRSMNIHEYQGLEDESSIIRIEFPRSVGIPIAICKFWSKDKLFVFFYRQTWQDYLNSKGFCVFKVSTERIQANP